MKSKSFESNSKAPGKVKQNKTFDFTSYYKSDAETQSIIGTQSLNKEAKVTPRKKTVTPKREISPNKKKKQLDISQIDTVGPNTDSSVTKISQLNVSKVTSTPQTVNKTVGQLQKVKSIMKNKSLVHTEDSIDDSQVSYSPSKPKKRNKSVSFMLDDNEEVVTKKSKSNDSIKIGKKSASPKKNEASKSFNNDKKFKKRKLSGKENKISDNMNAEIEDTDNKQNTEPILEARKVKSKDIAVKDLQINSKKGKLKKVNKQESGEISEPNRKESNNNEQMENKNKKNKKKKQLLKSPPTSETGANGEPIKLKNQVKPEAIVENLENLTIGDNAHTLTNLLDEMTVAEKDKMKKNKRKLKKDKKTERNSDKVATNTPNNEMKDTENAEEGKEKIKWKKRKWNKDRKGDVDEEAMPTSVIVAKLPLSTMFTYKKLLADHFEKYGQIKKIGIAEVYPTEESKPIFTTTIIFNSEGAASEALAENGSEFEGERIVVRRPLPPTQTTIVVRSYAELSDQALSSAFLPAGRIRTIRHLVKGKKTIGTAFIEFDGPETVEKALKLAIDAKIAGKKIHVSKFEIRKKNKVKKPKHATESEQEEDSEDSND